MLHTSKLQTNHDSMACRRQMKAMLRDKILSEHEIGTVTALDGEGERPLYIASVTNLSCTAVENVIRLRGR